MKVLIPRRRKKQNRPRSDELNVLHFVTLLCDATNRAYCTTSTVQVLWTGKRTVHWSDRLVWSNADANRRCFRLRSKKCVHQAVLLCRRSHDSASGCFGAAVPSKGSSRGFASEAFEARDTKKNRVRRSAFVFSRCFSINSVDRNLFFFFLFPSVWRFGTYKL